MDLQQVIHSSLSIRIASALAQRLPPRLGYAVAYGIAEQLARRRESRLIQAIRLNQWMSSRETLQAAALDEAVRETLRYWARSLFDLYHYSHDFNATRQRLVFDPSFEIVARRPEFDPRAGGLLIAGLHLSNFDLVLQWLCRNGLKPLVLTIPNPTGGRQVEYEVRKRLGMNLIPASVGALRQALRHLERGGMVLTGIDRPVAVPGVRPKFFGRPAALPVHHIYLASKAAVPVVIAAVYLQPDGCYHVFGSDPIEMDQNHDIARGTLRNAEKVLAVAAKFIERSPRQWSVPLPVWPASMDQAERGHARIDDDGGERNERDQ